MDARESNTVDTMKDAMEDATEDNETTIEAGLGEMLDNLYQSLSK